MTGVTVTTNEGEIRRLRKIGAFWMIFPPILGLVPFFNFSGWMLIATAAVGGGVSRWYFDRASKMQQIKAANEKYQFDVLEDCSFIDRTYIGHGMEFNDYKSAFEARTLEIGKIDPKEQERLHSEQVKRMKPFYLTDDDATRHFLTYASTGLGKTELLLSIIRSSVISRGSGCLIFDAKGDETLISKVYAMAKEASREDDVRFVNFNRPEYSHTYNPLLYGNVREGVSSVMKLFDTKGEQFFRDMARGALTAAFLVIRAQPEPVAFNFSDLAVLFSEYGEMDRLYRNVVPEHPDRGVIWSFLKQFHGHDYRGEPFIDTKRYSELLTGLHVKMLDFSHSEYRHVLNDYSPDIELKRAIMENKIIVVVIPALSDKEGVTLFGRLFLADLSRAIGQIQQDRMKPALPFFCFLDEYPSFADESHIELWQQARSANVSLWPAAQGKGFMDRVAPFFGDNLGTNNWHHFYFDIRDPKSREYAAKLAGTTIRRFRSESDSESFAYSRENTKTGAIRNENLGKSRTSSVRETREDLLQPDDFLMDAGNAILVAKRGVYRMTLPIVEFDLRIPTLDEIELARFEKPNVRGLNLMRERLKREDRQIG